MFDRRFDKLLIPYLEGSLDPHRRAMLEEAIANDSQLAEEVEEMRRLKYQLQKSAANFTSPESNRSAWPGVHARIRDVRQPVYNTTSFWGLGLAMGAAATLAIYFGGPYLSNVGSSHTEAASINASTLNLTAPISLPNHSAVVSINGNDLGNAVADLLPSNILPAIKRPDRSSAAYISVPSILPAGPHGTSMADQVQLADANIPQDGSVHGSIVSLAPYSMPFTEPATVSTAPSAPPHVRTASTDSSMESGPDPFTAPIDARPIQVGSSAITKGPDGVDQIASQDKSIVPTTMHLATMSAPATTTDSSSADSPLITQLKAVDDSANTDASNGIQSRALARWQSVLQATSSSSIFGDDPAQLLSMQSLQEIQAAGLLSTMRQELEVWQEQDPNNIGVRRMLASLYSVAGEASLALDERRKAAGLPTAIGEDWFQLGLSEEQAGNLNSANTDYSKAQQCGDLSNPMHINFIRQRLPQSDS
jgi:hypothetical protein